MKRKQMGLGIIGCGVVANTHVKAIRSVKEAALLGVAGFSAEEAEAFAEKHRTHGYASTEALLRDENVEAVCICTPSGLHETLAVQAAKAGKHVIVEKPLALSGESAEKILCACRENHVTGTVISQLRFSDAVQKTKKAIAEGRLGRIVMANLSMKYYRSSDYYAKSNWRGTWKMDGGGALMNQGIHGVDVLVYLLGVPTMLYGNIATLARRIETEDNATACLTFPGGAIGTICASTAAYPGFDRMLEIHGERGSIVLHEDKIATWEIEGEKAEDHFVKTSDSASDPTALNPAGHAMQIRDFIGAVWEGRAPLVTLEDGKKVVEVITSVYRSSEKKQPVFDI